MTPLQSFHPQYFHPHWSHVISCTGRPECLEDNHTECWKQHKSLNTDPQLLCTNERIHFLINPLYQSCTVKILNSWSASTSSLFDQHWLCALLQDKKEINQSMQYLSSLFHNGITSSPPNDFRCLIKTAFEHLIISNTSYNRPVRCDSIIIPIRRPSTTKFFIPQSYVKPLNPDN